MSPRCLDASLLYGQRLTLRGRFGELEEVTATVVDVDGDGQYSEGDLLLAFDADRDGHADRFELEATDAQRLRAAAGGGLIDKARAQELGLSLVDPSAPAAGGGWSARGVSELQAAASQRLCRAELYVDPQRSRLASYELVDEGQKEQAVRRWKGVERAGFALCGLGVVVAGVAFIAGTALLPVLPLAVAALGAALSRKASGEVLSALLTTDASPIARQVERRST